MSTKTLLRKRTRAPKSPRLQSFAAEVDVASIFCESCSSGDSDELLLLCDNCDRGFHTFCLRPILPTVPNGSWFCPSCSGHRTEPKAFPLVQTKIVDFFRIQRNTGWDEDVSSRKKRKRNSSPLVVKKKRRLLPFVPTKDIDRRLQQMASLATALTATRAEFSNDLTYAVPGMAPRFANQAGLEREGMQVLSRDDRDTLILCKKMMTRGEWPPLMVVFDPLEGYTVQADKFIRDLTIVTEYTGDVDYLKNRENDDCDSMMTLLSAKDYSRSLVICPDKRSNIARFISGINNHTPEGKKKQNLKCVRFDVNGESRVLLIAIRDISKGERLYYDYNGYEKEYPTEHFV